MEEIRKSVWKSVEEPLPTVPVHKLLFGALRHNLETQGDRTWLIDGVNGHCILFSEILPMVYSVAGNLRNRGFRPGNLIAMFLSNRHDFFVPILASWVLGGGVTMVANTCVVNQAIRQLNDSRPIFLFCDTETLESGLVVKDDVSSLEEIFVFGTDKVLTGAPTFDTLLSGDFVEEDFEDVIYEHERSPVYLPYSSGTTGYPKGIVHTHRSLVAMCLMLKQMISPGNTVFAATNMFHISGFLMGLRGILLHLRSVFLGRFSEEDFLRGIERFSPSTVLTLPPILVSLSKKPAYVAAFNVSSVQFFWTLSSYLRAELEESILKVFPSTNIMQIYGMTENGFALMNCGPGVPCFPHESNPGTIGLPAPYMEIKVLEEGTDFALGPNKKGEICTRSPCNFAYYLNNPQATNSTLRDGWLHTGDQGYFDEDGFFFFTDRVKELIKYRGMHVVPAILDTLITSIPGVLDAAVVGIPDDENGELPHACVVKQDSATIEEGEIRKFVERALSDNEQLRGGVSFVSQIPRNDSLKVLRKLLLKHVLSKQSGRDTVPRAS